MGAVRKDLLAGVIALADETPVRFVNLIKNAWPEIKAAIDQGHTLKVIHERLVRDGVRISYRLFTFYVHQLLGKTRQPRDKGAKPQRKMAAPPKVRNSKISTAKPIAAVVSPHERPLSQSVQDDPWRNVRERLETNRPGFSWDEESLPDETKLY